MSKEAKDVLDTDISKAQLQKLELEIEKLRYDIQGLKGTSYKFERALRFLPLITTLIAIAAFWFTVHQYNSQQATAASKLESDRQHALLTPLWTRRLDAYFAAAESTATFASAKDQAEKEKAEARFLQLYYGQLVLVEDPEVEKAMVYFNRCITGEDVCDESELKQRSLKLAGHARHSLETAFGIKLGNLEGR